MQNLSTGLCNEKMASSRWNSRKQIAWRLILLPRFLIVLTIIFILLVRMQTKRKHHRFQNSLSVVTRNYCLFLFFPRKKKKLIAPVAVRGWHSSNLDCLSNFSKHNRNIPHRTERDSTMEIESFFVVQISNCK